MWTDPIEDTYVTRVLNIECPKWMVWLKPRDDKMFKIVECADFWPRNHWDKAPDNLHMDMFNK